MIRWRWLGLSIATIFFLVALPASMNLRLDRSLEAMFAKEDRIRVDFERLESIFGVSDLIVFAYRDPKLWSDDGEGLERLHRIRQRIESLGGIDSAMDLTKVNSMIQQWNATLGAFSSSKSPIHRKYPLLNSSDPMAIKLKAMFEGQTHAKDSDLVAIACILKKNANNGAVPPTHSRIIRELRAIDIESTQPVQLAGQSVMVEEGFEAIESDGRRLGLFSAISLSVLLWIGFRSLRWALILVAVVQWSLVVTRALLVLLNWELTMVSSMLASIVTVIGVATTMHWMLGYQRLTSQGMEPEMALQDSLRQLRRPIVWACVTDAIGFLSLAFAKVGPVQDYGWMMAIASLIVLAAIFLIVPGLALIPLCSSPWDRRLGLQIPIEEFAWLRQEKRWGVSTSRLLKWCSKLSCRFPRAIIATSVLIGIVAIVGSLRIELETDFVKNFRSDSPLVIAYRNIEKELGGAGVWDVAIPVPDSMGLSETTQLLKFGDRLRSIRVGSDDSSVSLSHVMSVVDADSTVSEHFLMKRIGFEGRLISMKPMMGGFFESLVGREEISGGKQQRYVRIMLRSREQVAAKDKRSLMRAVRDEIASFKNDWKHDASGRAFVSGYYVLLAELVSSVIEDQWRCFAIAGVGIWIAIWFALRDMKLVTMAVLPNVLPSLCILGWFGWTGTPMNLGAAMIAAVSMGLSVDSSIHYLNRYQTEVAKGSSPMDALESAQSDIGLAMLLATLALVVGFGALATSDFLPTVVFGVTAALSMIGGLIGNLLILPALLRLNSGRPRVAHHS